MGTFFASLAVLAYIVINILRRRDPSKSRTVSQTKAESYVSAVLSGGVSANGVFHFLHGILNYRDFPAPFGAMLGGGLVNDISNIIWGLFCLSMALILIQRHQKLKVLATWQFALLFLFGFTGISLLLYYVFLPDYFATHPF